MASSSAIREYEERILAYEHAVARPRPRRAPPARDRPSEGAPRRPRARTRPRRRASPLRMRARRIAALTVLLLVADVVLSFSSAMLRPSNVSAGVRIVEWLRDHGAAGLVSDFEAIYYSLNAPATGGPALKRLPEVGDGRTAAAGGYQPPPVPPAIEPALPGEGVWHGTGPLVAGRSPVLVTTLRPDPNYPQLVAGLAWIDTAWASLALYPGRYEPPGAGAPPAQVPPELRPGLLATFNAGFKLEDSGGGFFADGRAYAALRDGQATLIGYRDGTVDVRVWTGGPVPGANIVFARQNLPLIRVRRPPGLESERRTGVGRDARQRGARVALGGRCRRARQPHLRRRRPPDRGEHRPAASARRRRPGDGARHQLRVGHVQLLRRLGAAAPQKLLPDMTRDATRYLTPDDRDFFAVYARRGSAPG